MPRFSYASALLVNALLSASTVAFNETQAADAGTIRINEVSDKGSTGICSGSDWIEVHLPAADGGQPLNLTGYILHDDNGADDDGAYAFPPTIVSPGEYLLLCSNGPDSAKSPQFGIGGGDTLTLLDRTGATVSSTGVLRNRGDIDVTFAFDDKTGAYDYTTTPTPGTANVLTALPSLETVQEIRTRLKAQNDAGTAFFDMDGDGLPVEGGFDDVVDLRMKMDPNVHQQMMLDQEYKLYSPFLSAAITLLDRPDDVLLDLTSAGRIRPKGQSTLVYGTCMNRSIPFSIDWDHTNATQTLFGIERSYLRTHFSDGSHVREWSMHRMLARFGLPHLRTRTVRFFLNEKYIGMYDLLEAPDQDYVFQRSFPDFDPENYALYKVKTLSLFCGMLDEATLAKAEERVDEPETPPYIYDRGSHRPKVPVLGNDKWEECSAEFRKFFGLGVADLALAYVRAGRDCGKALVQQGQIDRDLGVNSLDETMEAFINRNLGSSTCDDKCSNSNLVAEVNVANFLRNFAVMAAMLNQDSPLGNGNNYYFAYTGGSNAGWNIVQYDHNSILSDTSAFLCDASACSADLIHWSIVRPTCRAFEQNRLAGPLLSNEMLHGQYIEYVREFVLAVMTNQTFLDQVRGHLEAIQGDAKVDQWNDSAMVFYLELADDDQWNHDLIGIKYIPFLPALRARSKDILDQLKAIDEDKVPRELEDVSPWEACINWQKEGPSTSCPKGCSYEGCYRPELTVPAFCDEASGTCFHGVADEKCRGITNSGRYGGMVGFEESDGAPFCWSDPTVGPLRMAQCPPEPSAEPEDKPASACSGGCVYDGCHMPELTVPSHCDEESGLCYHGDADEKCAGIPDGQSYDGMAGFNGSDKPSFCVLDENVGPLRVAQCPPKPAPSGTPTPAPSGTPKPAPSGKNTNTSNGFKLSHSFLAVAALSLLMAAI